MIEIYKGFEIRIEQDEIALNPRKENDNLGTILYTSSRYLFGDKQVTKEEIDEVRNQKDTIWLDIYVRGSYDIRLASVDLRDMSDYKCCGIIYTTLKQVNEAGILQSF